MYKNIEWKQKHFWAILPFNLHTFFLVLRILYVCAHALNAILAEAPLREAIYNNTELGGAWCYSICVVSHAGEVKFNQVTLIPRKEFQNKSCNLLYTFGAHLQTYMPS